MYDKRRILFILSFNPRTPCGVRRMRNTTLRAYQLFQSTHSLRSATRRKATCPRESGLFQSTHSLRSATPRKKSSGVNGRVSIHALLAECDVNVNVNVNVPCGFNPRTPCGVRLDVNELTQKQKRFNPRTPCGVRPARAFCPSSCTQFQSTHSLRSATEN